MAPAPPILYHTLAYRNKDALWPDPGGPTSYPMLQTLLTLLFPSDCSICLRPLTREGVPFICQPCWSRLAPLSGPFCPRCGRPLASPQSLTHSPRHHCGPCREHPPAFAQAWSLFAYHPPLNKALTLWKYHRKTSLSGPLTHLLVQHLPPLPAVDLIIPVPWHPQRLREREVNQSAILAHPLSLLLERPLGLGRLIRTRPTLPQTSLARTARLTNLRGAFAVSHPERIRQRTILLVDDVMTTGTTLHECADSLQRAGSGPVYALTLARTVS